MADRPFDKNSRGPRATARPDAPADPSDGGPRDPLVLGAREWLALPDLGLPALIAKIDTGARTSALHAAGIETFARDGKPFVRFRVAPIPGRQDEAVHGEIVCEAPLVARRWITSSNGERERRCVILTTVELAGRRWSIEVSLTDRGSMRHRMLLGQQALPADMIVRPRAAFLQPVLDFARYAQAGPPDSQAPPLRIGLVGAGVTGRGWQRLAEAASARGHIVERIDTRSAVLDLADSGIRLVVAGREVPFLDACIACLDPEAGPHALAVLEHLASRGTRLVNSVAGLARAADERRLHRRLVEAGVASTATEATADGMTRRSAGRSLACLVAGDRVPSLDSDASTTPGAELGHPGARRIALDAARALGLGLARVDLRVGRTRVAIDRIAADDTALAALGRPRIAAHAAAAVIEAVEMATGRHRTVAIESHTD